MPTKTPKPKKGVKVRVTRAPEDGPSTNLPSSQKLDELLNWQRQPIEEVQKIDRQPTRPRWPWIAGGIILIAVVTYAGFALFTRSQGKFSEDDISVEIQVPSSVSSGEEFAVTILYTNNTTVDLANSTLTMSYPEGFQVTSAEPPGENDSKSQWDTGKVKAGLGGRIVVRGQLFGELNAVTTFNASLGYRPANFNSDFTRKAEASTTITSSLVSATFDAVTKAVPNKSVTLTLTVKNTATTDLKNLKVIFDENPGFTLSASDPKTDETKTWALSTLKPDAETTIKFTGSFSGKVGEKGELTVRVGVVGTGDSFTLQQTATVSVQLVNPELSLDVKRIAPATDPVSLGQEVSYQATLKNNSDVTVTDVVVTGTLSKNLVNWTNFTTTPTGDTGAASSQGLITWNKSHVPDLAQLKAGQSLTFTLNVTLRNVLENQKGPISLESGWKAITGRVESLGSTLEATAPTVTTKLATTPKLVAEGRFYSEEGDAVGTGPLPPQVGKTTTYKVRWLLSNGINDLNGTTVTAVLPTTAFWTGKNTSASVGSLTFDPATRTVKWTVNKLPALTGQGSPELIAEFDVSITPKQSDVGLLMVLMEKSTVAGTDGITQSGLTIDQPRITTDLQNDVNARGLGVVVAAS